MDFGNQNLKEVSEWIRKAKKCIFVDRAAYYLKLLKALRNKKLNVANGYQRIRFR